MHNVGTASSLFRETNKGIKIGRHFKPAGKQLSYLAAEKNMYYLAALC